MFRPLSFTHAIHFTIHGLLADPSDFLQQCEAWKQCTRPANISNEWLVWCGFLQVLLEIMSQVVISECCLQGLLDFPLAAWRQRKHQSEGDTTLSCNSSPSVVTRSRFIHLHAVRPVGKLPARWGRHSAYLMLISLDFYTQLIVLTGLSEV